MEQSGEKVPGADIFLENKSCTHSPRKGVTPRNRHAPARGG
jgi:hypothetical protein